MLTAHANRYITLFTLAGTYCILWLTVGFLNSVLFGVFFKANFTFPNQHKVCYISVIMDCNDNKKNIQWDVGSSWEIFSQAKVYQSVIFQGESLVWTVQAEESETELMRGYEKCGLTGEGGFFGGDVDGSLAPEGWRGSAGAACSQKVSLWLFICGLAALQWRPYHHYGHRGRGHNERTHSAHGERLRACEQIYVKTITHTQTGILYPVFFTFLFFSWASSASQLMFHFLFSI